MTRRLALFLACLLPLAATADLRVVIVEGLGGNQEYGKRFATQSGELRQALATMTGADNIRMFSGAAATREAVLAYFETLAGAASADDRTAVFLIGHGSYDGYEYKFNLPGPDINGADILALLNRLPGRQLLVNTSSTSGVLLKELEDDRRVVITATRSGNERNATRFGGQFTAALNDPAADLDKDARVSAREAFDYAARLVEDSYADGGQLATEHPQLQGEGADRFVLARLDAARESPADPELARLFTLRGRLEGEIEELRDTRARYTEEEYLARLQDLLVELAELEERIDKLDAPGAR